MAENARLWLAFCEDWENEDNNEALACAMAAAGTLAVAASDEGVSKALLAEGCGKCIANLIDSQNPDLCHRSLVMAIEFLQVLGSIARDHLGECDVVGAITRGLSSYSSNLRIVELVKELALAMNSIPHK